MNPDKNTQCLRDPNIEPTDSILNDSLKDAYPSYLLFLNLLKQIDVDLVWRYYTDGKAWLAKGIYRWTGKKGSDKEMSVFWCSIWNGFFKIVIYIPEDKREDILNLQIDDNLKIKIREIKRMGETFRTLPIVFDIHSNEELESILKIIVYKKGLRK